VQHKKHGLKSLSCYAEVAIGCWMLVKHSARMSLRKLLAKLPVELFFKLMMWIKAQPFGQGFSHGFFKR